MERINDFLHLNSDVYVSYGNSCKKSNALLEKLANRKSKTSKLDSKTGRQSPGITSNKSHSPVLNEEVRQISIQDYLITGEQLASSL